MVVLLFFSRPAFAEISQADKEATYKQLELFSNILSILQENYVEEINTKEALNGAIRGLLYSLDPHSSYLAPESFKDLQDETRGSFSGIGIEVTIKNDLLTIVSPIADTPADQAGLKANDVILEIDGKKTKNMGSYEAIEKLRGPAGSSVTLVNPQRGMGRAEENDHKKRGDTRFSRSRRNSFLQVLFTRESPNFKVIPAANLKPNYSSSKTNGKLTVSSSISATIPEACCIKR